ncbi:hypothetical protein MFIFM68171_01790 [Madurella fahalii]|uniref:BPL/LPL catalytic domain-containing protein n=1 Tax=Madurella fahalii TaxID=1157608 RepID=A0ABQ0G1Z1_9PEZI
MRLRHLHLPSIHPRYVPYSLASRVQEHVRRQHLDFKDDPAASGTQAAPPPTLISFTPHPIYTLGRRQTAPLSPGEIARLTAPLQVRDGGSGGSGGSNDNDNDNDHDHDPPATLRPGLAYSLRGGLTTYHGPGQVVLWPVLDLRSPAHRRLTVRCYSRLLEDTTIAALRGAFGVRAFTTDDPGVWVRVRPEKGAVEEDGDGVGVGEVAKIAALGVHLRRHVSALGTAVNVDFPGLEVTDEGRNPWARIVACGLEGKTVASLAGLLPGGAREVGEKLAELAVARTTSGRAPLYDGGGARSVGARTARMVAGAWAEELARRLGLEGVDVVGTVETMDLMDNLLASVAIESDEGVEEGIEFLKGVRGVLSDQAR